MKSPRHTAEEKFETAIIGYPAGLTVDQLLDSIKDKYSENSDIRQCLNDGSLKEFFTKITVVKAVISFRSIMAEFENLPIEIAAEAIFLTTERTAIIKDIETNVPFIFYALNTPKLTLPLIEKLFERMDATLLHKVVLTPYANQGNILDHIPKILSLQRDLEIVKQLNLFLNSIIEKTDSNFKKTLAENTIIDYGNSGVSVEDLLFSIKARYQSNPIVCQLLENGQLQNTFERARKFYFKDLEKLPEEILIEALFLSVKQEKYNIDGGALIVHAIMAPKVFPIIQRIIKRLDSELLHKLMIASHTDFHQSILAKLIGLAAQNIPSQAAFIQQAGELLQEIIIKLPEKSFNILSTSENVIDVFGNPIAENNNHIENLFQNFIYRSTSEHFKLILDRISRDDLISVLTRDSKNSKAVISQMQANENFAEFTHGYMLFNELIYNNADSEKLIALIEKAGDEFVGRFITSCIVLNDRSVITNFMYAKMTLPKVVFDRLLDWANPIAVLRTLILLGKTYSTDDEHEHLLHADPVIIANLAAEFPEESILAIPEFIISAAAENGEANNLYQAFFELGRYHPEIFSKIISNTSQEILDQLIFHVFASNGTGLEFAARLLPSEIFIKLIELSSADTINLILLRTDEHDLTDLLWFGIALEDDAALQALLKKADYNLINNIINQFPTEYKFIKFRMEKLLSAEKVEENLLEEKITVNHSASSEKTLDELLIELREKNQHDADVVQAIDSGYLVKLIDGIAKAEQHDSTLHKINKPINKWDDADILAWTKLVRQSAEIANSEDFLPEMYAVISRAIQLDAEYKPRKAQLIATLLFGISKDKGRLNQVATGEGKSDIVAILAIINVLRGHTVDVVTSSPILAQRDALEKKNLYGIFGITVDDNWDIKDGKQIVCIFKKSYNADIIYGALVCYQWDILRAETNICDARRGRAFDTVIVDEVDNMSIDAFKNMAIISGDAPAMEYLEILLISAWQQLVRIDLELDEEKIEDSKIRQECIRKILKEYLTNLIHSESSLIIIPKHLKEFADYQIDNWVDSAIQARYMYTLGREYVVTLDDDGNKIVAPVDNSTGIVEKNLIWERGLHQFLQIKEGLKLRAESVFSAFMSNVAFFEKYGNRIYGMTGTIGDENTQKLLTDVYPVNLSFVPTFRPKDFTAYPGVLAKDRTAWLNDIAKSVINETKKQKPMLIICENINEVDAIQEKLKNIPELNGSSIERYSRNDNDEINAVQQLIDSRKIIIATNLAGRGTDFKLSQSAKEHGGLHVILTYLPDNQRVEDQALGRSARQGDPGSGELIIDKTSAMQTLNAKIPLLEDVNSVDELKVWRDTVEAARLNRVREFDLPRLKLRDKLFQHYVNFTNELRKIDDNKTRIDEISEMWAFWLAKIDDQIIENHKADKSAKIDEENILNQFAEFVDNCRKFYANPGNMENPCFIISNALKQENPAEALAYYDQAIGKDRIAAVQGFYNRAFTRLNEFGASAASSAIEDLKAAKSIIAETLIPHLQTMHIILNLNPEQQDANSATSQDIIRRIQVYQKQIQNIDASIDKIRSFDPSSEVAVGFTPELSHFYKSINLSYDVQHEFRMTGLNGFYEVEEIPEDDDDGLFGSLCVAFIGVVQIVVGVALTISGMGAIGAALISEGVGDLIYAARSVIDGRCSLNEYLNSKATSVAITVITMGIDAIKAARVARTASAREVGKQLTREELKAVAIESVKNAVVKSSIKEVINFGLDYLTREALKSFEDDIADAVRDTLSSAFNNPEVKSAVDKILFADAIVDNNLRQQKLIQLAQNILRHKLGAGNLAAHILKGILARQDANIAKAIRLFDIADALEKIINLTKSFGQDFSRAVKISAQSLPDVSKDMSQERDSLYESLVEMITNNLMPALHKKVISPAAQVVGEKYIDELANKIQKNTSSAQKEVTQKVSEADLLFEQSRKELREFKGEIDNLGEWTTQMQERNMPLHDLTSNPVMKGIIGPIVSSDMPRKKYVASSSSSSSLEEKSIAANFNQVISKQSDSPVDTEDKTNFLSENTLKNVEELFQRLELGAEIVSEQTTAAATGIWEGLWDLTAIIREGYALIQDTQTVIDNEMQKFYGPHNELGLFGFNTSPDEARAAQDRINQRAETISHVVTEVTSLVYDAAIISAAHLPNAQIGAISAQDFDAIEMMQQAIDINPALYHDAVKRMETRGTTVQNIFTQFKNLEGPEQTRVVSRIATSFAGPGIIAKAGKTIYANRLHLFPRIEGQSVLFKNKFPNESRPPQSVVDFLTLDKIRNRAAFYDLQANKGEQVKFIWVILQSGELKMASRLRKGVERRSTYRDHKKNGESIPHSLLSNGEPVEFAGEAVLLRKKNGSIEIRCINDRTGHFHSRHREAALKVENKFIETGFHESEIRGKFISEYPHLDFPEVPLVQVPPAADFIPSAAEITKGAAFGAASSSIAINSSSNTENEEKTAAKQDNNFLNSVQGVIRQGFYAVSSSIVGDAYAEQKSEIPPRINFEDFDKKYQADKKIANKPLLEMMGGKVAANSGYKNDNPGNFYNLCTIRLSKALNDAGHKIPFIKDKTVSYYNSRGNLTWAFYRLNDMKDYLTDTWGKPNVITENNSANYLDRKGIVLVMWPDGMSSTASGHATYGAIPENLREIEYYEPGSKLLFWELPTKDLKLENHPESLKMSF